MVNAKNTSVAVSGSSFQDAAPVELPAMTVVATYQHPLEAELAVSRLHSGGMDAWLQDGNTTQVQNLWSIALGGVKVVVATEDAEAARLLLDALAPAETWKDAGLEGAEDPPVSLEADALARRAWQSAVLGMVAPVIFHLYSTWLLVLFLRAPGPASHASRRRAGLALLINAAVLGVASLLVFHTRGWQD